MREPCGGTGVGASCEQGPARGLAAGEAERYGSPASQPADLARQEERAEQLTSKVEGRDIHMPFSAQSYRTQSGRGPCSRPGEGTQASASRGLEQQGRGKTLRTLSGTAGRAAPLGDRRASKGKAGAPHWERALSEHIPKECAAPAFSGLSSRPTTASSASLSFLTTRASRGFLPRLPHVQDPPTDHLGLAQVAPPSGGLCPPPPSPPPGPTSSAVTSDFLVKEVSLSLVFTSRSRPGCFCRATAESCAACSRLNLVHLCKVLWGHSAGLAQSLPSHPPGGKACICPAPKTQC